MEVYRLLFARYGPQNWWPGDSPFEVMVGAILTQSTSWRNVEKAIGNLKKAGMLDLARLADAPGAEIASLVRSSGYYNAKARKLKAMCQWVKDRYAGNLDRVFARDLPRLRAELLDVYGIGDETADSIILYAAEKPVFVIDAYTRRILGRLGLGPENGSYSDYQAYCMAGLPHEAALFNEFHALFVRHGKDICRKSQPACGECCLKPVCPPAPVGGRAIGSE